MSLGTTDGQSAAASIAAVKHALGAEFPDRHLGEPGRWVAAAQIGMNIPVRPDCAQTDFPITAGVAAD